MLLCKIINQIFWKNDRKRTFSRLFLTCNPDVSSKDPKLPPWFRGLHNQKHMSSVLDNNVGTSITNTPSWYILVSVFGNEYNPFATKMILKLFLQVRCHFWLISTISDFRNNNRVNDIYYSLQSRETSLGSNLQLYNPAYWLLSYKPRKLKHALQCRTDLFSEIKFKKKIEYASPRSRFCFFCLHAGWPSQFCWEAGFRITQPAQGPPVHLIKIARSLQLLRFTQSNGKV